MMRTMRDVESAAMWLRGQLDVLGQAEYIPTIVCARMVGELEDIADYCRWARTAGMTPIRPYGDAGTVSEDDEPIPYRLGRRRPRRAAQEVQT